jgi:hypothetical protein
MDLMLDYNIELFPLVNGDSLRWPLLRHYPEMAVHPPQMARMTTTKIETYGDQMVKEGEVWKKIMTMLCMGRCDIVFLLSSGLTLFVGPAGVQV